MRMSVLKSLSYSLVYQYVNIEILKYTAVTASLENKLCLEKGNLHRNQEGQGHIYFLAGYSQRYPCGRGYGIVLLVQSGRVCVLPNDVIT